MKNSITFALTLIFSLFASWLVSTATHSNSIFFVSGWEFQFVIYSFILSLQFVILRKNLVYSIVTSVLFAGINAFIAKKFFYMLPFSGFIQPFIISLLIFTALNFAVKFFWLNAKVKLFRVLGFSVACALFYGVVMFAMQAVFSVAQAQPFSIFMFRGAAIFLACSTGFNFAELIIKKTGLK